MDRHMRDSLDHFLTTPPEENMDEYNQPAEYDECADCKGSIRLGIHGLDHLADSEDDEPDVKMPMRSAIQDVETGSSWMANQNRKHDAGYTDEEMRQADAQFEHGMAAEMTEDMDGEND